MSSNFVVPYTTSLGYGFVFSVSCAKTIKQRNNSRTVNFASLCNENKCMTADLKKEKFIRMTTAPVGHLVSSLAVPSIISMLVPGIYNLADITGPRRESV